MISVVANPTASLVKIWKQDEKATPESHPLVWQPTLSRRKF